MIKPSIFVYLKPQIVYQKLFISVFQKMVGYFIKNLFNQNLV